MQGQSIRMRGWALSDEEDVMMSTGSVGSAWKQLRSLPWADIRATANATRFRYRDQLWPLVILAVVALARFMVDGANPSSILVATLFISVAIVFYLRRKLDRTTEWIYAGACLGSEILGLTLTAMYGLDDYRLNAFDSVSYIVLAGIWWMHHEVRGVPKMSTSNLVNLWNCHIRDGKGRLAGAEIGPPIPFEHGNSHTVKLVPYKHTLAIAQADLPNISSGVDTPLENLLLEAHPDYPKRPTMLRLQHVTRSPIENTVWFDKPRFKNGRILLGPYADGIGEAYLRLYEGGQSMWSTTCTAGTGSGKTRLMECVAISALAMRDVGQHTVLFYIDGQNGASSPTLFEHATWAVGSDGALRMISALERIADWRNKENRGHQPKPLTGFTPSAERPGIFVLIDEAHLILSLQNNKAAERLAKLAKSVRKLGIAFFVAAHDYGLNTMKDDTLRAALLGGNGLVMNVSSRITGNLIPGLAMDPFDIPKIPGYGIVVGAAGSDIRTAPYRGRYAPDDMEKDRSLARGETVTVPSIETWFELYPALELDPKAAYAAGEDYHNRHETAEREREELLQYINAIDESDPLERELAELVEAEAIDLDVVRANEQRSITCAQRIQALDWVSIGEAQVAQVMAYMPELDMSTVRKALDKLASEGYLDKDSTQPQRVTYRRSKASTS
jgi:hypothetical protein